MGLRTKMGLFSKKAKVNPTVETQGLRIEFDSENEIWQFSDEGINFVVYGPVCAVPTRDQLQEIQADINRLRPEMAQKVEHGLKDCGGVKMNDGETLLVNITEFQSQSAFDVCWSGGKSWGDLGVDFTIKKHEITAESWGD
jgi:hypothetical protein